MLTRVQFSRPEGLRFAALVVAFACTVGRGAAARGEAPQVARPQSLEECEELFAVRPADKETAVCFNDLAKAEGPRELVERADAKLARLASEHPELPWFSYYAANRRYSDAGVAEGLYRRAAERFQSSGQVEGEVYSRLSRSKVLSRLGREREAREELGRFFELTEASDDPKLRAWGQLELVRQLLRSGQDLDRAYSVLRAMGASPPGDEPYELRRDRLLLLGNVCIHIGRLDESRRALRELADMSAAASDRFTEASARYNLAAISFERFGESANPRQLRETRDLAAQALAAAMVAGNRTVEAKAAWMLGAIAPEEERHRYLERCLAVAPTPELRGCCLGAIASRQAHKDPVTASRNAERALALAEGAKEIWPKLFVLRAWMRVQWETAAPAEALAASWEALGTLEALRDRQPEGSEIQAGLFSVWSDDYPWLAGRLLESAEAGVDRIPATDEAFRVDERLRARALIDWLRKADPEAAEAAVNEFPSLDGVRSALGPREALVSFQVAPWQDVTGDFGGGSWAMVITQDRVAVHRLPGRVEVRGYVKIFEGLIKARSGADVGPAARLYDKLLAPALAGLPPEVERLILVPDDALHRLPFAALRESAGAEPLGARYELEQVPSATLWLDWRRARAPAPSRPLLVLADPEPPGAGETVAPVEVAEDPVEVEIAAVREATQAFGRLPHARREGRAAVRAFGDGLLLTGPEASEAALLGLALRDFGILHFAAHAVTYEDRPERSAVLLAGGGTYDGLLQSAEIAGLDLAGRTVVLASCRSASGSVLRGEGVMSLARAFFQAGAHTVVASLWPLRDDESQVMFGRFYRRLAGGATVAEALHGARREAIAAGEPAAAWAGLVVLGDGSRAPVPEGLRTGAVGGRWWPRAAAGLALLASLGLAGAFAVRRSRAQATR